jgi:hypothetical protein
MSLIHEALEKVEQDKKAGREKKIQDFPVQELFGAPSNLDRKRERISFEGGMLALYGIGGILLLLFVGGIFYLSVVALHTKEFGGTPPESSSPVTSGIVVTPLSSARKGPNQFSLTGISRMGADWTAIVDNQLVRVGDWVSGAKVESIQ